MNAETTARLRTAGQKIAELNWRLRRCTKDEYTYGAVRILQAIACLADETLGEIELAVGADPWMEIIRNLPPSENLELRQP